MPVNKAKGEVALPEAGKDAFLCFTMDALERLETEYGEDYVETVLDGLGKARVQVYRTCVTVAGTYPEMAEMPFGMSLESLQERIVDALYLAIHGRTYLEQQKVEDDRFQERLKEAEGNPRLAAALFSQMSGKRDTDPDSDQKSSVASPPSA